ncbi:hypothetical protein E2C01_048563 [Portunus trituberculatus]|uniref:Uncharacterized protein n=1 Tax=Portunus trituberculatus TaxID=210409 RepID=A0A5B7G3F4_PORTR|nr:hypothetical protein [Portunus trituberculatus]
MKQGWRMKASLWSMGKWHSGESARFILGSDVKEIKRVAEKLPGFGAQQPNTTNIAEADSTTQTEAMPLKEKLLDPTTMQEITKHAKSLGTKETPEDDKQVVKVENEENFPPVKVETRKKPKKTVQLTEVVTVQESDGQVQEAKIKQEDGVKKIEKRPKPLRKLECPMIKENSGEQIEECKTQ